MHWPTFCYFSTATKEDVICQQQQQQFKIHEFLTVFLEIWKVVVRGTRSWCTWRKSGWWTHQHLWNHDNNLFNNITTDLSSTDDTMTFRLTSSDPQQYYIFSRIRINLRAWIVHLLVWGEYLSWIVKPRNKLVVKIIKTRLKILPVLTREHYTSLLHWV
jgi:hypothetical protein